MDFFLHCSSFYKRNVHTLVRTAPIPHGNISDNSDDSDSENESHEST